MDTNDNGEGVKYPAHQPSTHNSPSSHHSPLTAEPEEIHIPANDQEDCQEEHLEGLASLIPSITNCYDLVVVIVRLGLLGDLLSLNDL